MEKANQSSSTQGLTFPGALTVLFVGLKLSNLISWSWLWVLSPAWISMTIAIVFLILVATLGTKR